MYVTLLRSAARCTAALALGTGLCAQADQHIVFAHGFERAINIAPMGDVDGDGHADYALVKRTSSTAR
ncbi:MAG: hypothetical protein AAF628_35520, partial [Planctomycetota bacterium]